jgi:hypothetical protein
VNCRSAWNILAKGPQVAALIRHSHRRYVGILGEDRRMRMVAV